jgi:hypothetical protein
MKRFIFVLLALVVIAASVSPAYASGETYKGRGVFALVGKITAIDTANATVTVKVITGNTLVKPYIGKELVIKTTATTRFLYKTGTTITPITFADLVVGKPVSVNGILANSTWTAQRITIGAKLSCLP